MSDCTVPSWTAMVWSLVGYGSPTKLWSYEVPNSWQFRQFDYPNEAIHTRAWPVTLTDTAVPQSFNGPVGGRAGAPNVAAPQTSNGSATDQVPGRSSNSSVPRVCRRTTRLAVCNRPDASQPDAAPRMAPQRATCQPRASECCALQKTQPADERVSAPQVRKARCTARTRNISFQFYA